MPDSCQKEKDQTKNEKLTQEENKVKNKSSKECNEDSASGWGDVDDDNNTNENNSKTEWDTKGSAWDTDVTKDEKQTKEVTGWPEADDEKDKTKWALDGDTEINKTSAGDVASKQNDEGKQNTEHQGNQGWNSFGSSKPSRPINLENDGWGRGRDRFSQGFQSRSEYGNPRYGNNDYDRQNRDSFDRGRRGERDYQQSGRGRYGDSDGYHRGGYKRDHMYQREQYDGSEGYRQGYRRDGDFRHEEMDKNSYNSRDNHSRGGDVSYSYRGGNHYKNDPSFTSRSPSYNATSPPYSEDRNQSRHASNGFVKDDGYNKRKLYDDFDKRPRRNDYNMESPNRHSAYQSNYDAPRRDFPSNEATRRYLKPRPINPPPNKIIGIFGMPSSATEGDVREFILTHCPAVKIDDIRLVKNHETGFSRRFCFVYFSSIEESILAKESLAGKILKDREVRVDFSTSPEPRSRFNREE